MESSTTHAEKVTGDFPSLLFYDGINCYIILKMFRYTSKRLLT